MTLTFFVNSLVKSSTLVFGLVISLLISNASGAATLGAYALFVTYVNLFLILAKAGQDRFLVKAIAGDGLNKCVVYNAIKICIVAALLAIILFIILHLCGVISFYEIPATLLIIYFSIAVTGQVISSILISLLRGLHRVTLANIIESLPFNSALLVVVAIILFALQIKLTVPILLGAFAAIHLGLGVLLLFTFTIKKFPFNNHTLNAKVNNQAKSGAIFAFITGVTALNTSIDTLVLSYYQTSAQIGLYNVALKLSAIVTFSLVVASSIYTNQFALYASKGDSNNLKDALLRSTLLSSALAAVIFLLIITLQDWLLSFWGQEFNQANTALLILATAQLINVFFGPIGVLLSVAGFERLVLKTTFGVLLLNLLLNIVFIPKFGIEGAAGATAIAIILQNLIFYWCLKQSRVLEARS